MRRLVWFTCGFAVAALAAVYLLPKPCFLFAASAACVAALLFLVKGNAVRGVRIAAVGLAAGLVWCAVYFSLVLAPLASVCGEPAAFSATAVRRSADGLHGSTVEADVSVSGRRARATLWFRDGISLRPGDEFSGKAIFSQTIESDETYDVANDVFLYGEMTELTEKHRPKKIALRCLPAVVAETVQNKIAACVPEDAVGILTALVTGDRSKIPYAQRNRLILAGLYHAVSISGMHVSVLAAVLFFLLGKRRRLAAAVGTPVLLAFLLLTGASPSCVRAVTMQLALFLGAAIHREYDPVTVLCAALDLLLLENPWSAAHWGLQLSFAATLGILLFYPRIRPWIERKRGERFVLPAPVRAVLSTVAVTGSACAFSLPLSSAYFGVTSLISPICNVLCLWAVTGLFIGGLVTAILPAALAGALGGLIAWLGRWVYLVANTASKLPFCAVYAATPLMVLWAVAALELCFLALVVRPKFWELPAVCLLTLALAAALTYLPMDGCRNSFAVLDVGQGQCLVYRHDGETAVVDCGASGDRTGEEAARYLLSRGAAKVDAFVLTHFDEDHAGGAAQLLRRVSVRTLYIPVREADAEKIAAISAVAKETGTEVCAVTETVSRPNWTIYPPRSSDTTNESSLSVRFHADGRSVLVTGDMKSKTEAKLIAEEKLPPSDVFVAGHHGSEYSTGEALLAHCTPNVILCSAGEGNFYGHPSKKMLIRAAGHAIPVYGTIRNGTMEVRW